MTRYRTHQIESPIGPLLAIFSGDGALLRLDFLHQSSRGQVESDLRKEGHIVERDIRAGATVEHQLGEYFARRRRAFEVDLDLAGTPFQLEAWQALTKIPFGETRSYAEQAAAIGRPAAVRAIGRANGANPIPIIVPCHRVIGADGSLTGYGGGVAVKRQLLDLEATTPFR